MKIVVIGNGIAGTALVEEVLKETGRKDVRIQVFGEDRIFPKKKTLITEDGELYTYDKVVIATGSKPFIPP